MAEANEIEQAAEVEEGLCTHVSMHVFKVHMLVYTYAYVPVCKHVLMYVTCVFCVCRLVCMFSCVNVGICIYAYVCIHILAQILVLFKNIRVLTCIHVHYTRI